MKGPALRAYQLDKKRQEQGLSTEESEQVKHNDFDHAVFTGGVNNPYYADSRFSDENRLVEME